MDRSCWAAPLGGCDGPLTGEHLVTDAVLGRSVSVRGMPWCQGGFKTVGAASLTANILCDRHNSMLSEVDQVAADAKAALFWMLSPQTKQAWRYEERLLNGHKLARWAAKTACNLIVVEGHAAPPHFARYAFEARDDRELRVCFPFSVERRAPFSGDHIAGFGWLRSNRQPDEVCALVQLHGLPIILSTVPISREMLDLLQVFHDDKTVLPDRIRKLTWRDAEQGKPGYRQRDIRLMWP